MSKRSRKDTVESLGYSLSFTQSSSLDRDDHDADRYVTEISGIISHAAMRQDGSEVVTEVGSIDALRLQVGDAMDRGIAIYDWCDEHSAEAESYAAMILKHDANEFQEEVEATCGDLGFGCDVLAVLEIKLDEAHRGKRIGLAVMLETMRQVGGSCALTVIKPWPLQYSAKEFQAISKSGKSDSGKSAEDRDREFEALRKYWSQLGFARLAESDYYILSHAWKRPTCSEVLSGKFRPVKQKPGMNTRL